MEASTRLNGIGEYYFSQKLREIEQLNKQGRSVINLGIGSPDLPPHPEVIRVLQEESEKPNVHAYQNYKGSPSLRNEIASWYKKWYQVDLNADNEILPLIGSKEGIMHVCMAFINPGDKVLVPNPGYPTYRSAVTLAGGICIDYSLSEENNWEPDFDQLEETVSRESAKLMFVNYPQMPTGQLPSEKLFERLVQFASDNDVLLCHDNPYSFILNDKPSSLLAVKGAMEVAIELNSLSKSHNMAGWRIGMLLGNAVHIETVLRFKSNMDSGMFLPVQMAAVRALKLGDEWHDELNKVYAQRRQKSYELLDLLGCRYSQTQAGMFVWARIPEIYENSYSLSDSVLQACAVFITPGGIFGTEGEKYIRVSLCSSLEKFDDATQRVKQFFPQLSNVSV